MNVSRQLVTNIKSPILEVTTCQDQFQNWDFHK